MGDRIRSGAQHLRCHGGWIGVLVLLWSVEAGATHFRYGHLTWRSVGPNSVTVSMQNAWRRDAYSSSSGRCINPLTVSSIPCTGPGGFAGVGDIIHEAQGDTEFFWGDGSPPVASPLGSLLFLVTSIDIDDNWLFGVALDPDSLPLVDPLLRHTYAAPGEYLAYQTSCCRISDIDPPNEHINNPDGDFRVETRIRTAGMNNSPLSVLPPVLVCGIDRECSFPVLGADQDGDPLRYRLSTPFEATGGAFFVHPGPPFAPHGASIGNLSGVYSWDTADATLAGDPDNNTLYSTQVTIADTSSKVSLDFMLRLVGDSSEPPVITVPAGNLPVCQTVQVATVEQELHFELVAFDPDVGQAVVFNGVGLPPGAVTDPVLPWLGSVVTTAFSWTPAAHQGSDPGRPYSLNFFAISSAGLQTLCPVTILVFNGVPCDTDGDSDVDIDDIGLIFAARNQPADGPEDPRDIDADGWITVLDARVCTLQCDEPDCVNAGLPDPLRRWLRQGGPSP